MPGAAPYIAIILLSVGYLFRPMIALWLPLFGSFMLYAAAIAKHLEGIVPSERILFLALGVVPAVLMLMAWPLKAKNA